MKLNTWIKLVREEVPDDDPPTPSAPPGHIYRRRRRCTAFCPRSPTLRTFARFSSVPSRSASLRPERGPPLDVVPLHEGELEVVAPLELPPASLRSQTRRALHLRGRSRAAAPCGDVPPHEEGLLPCQDLHIRQRAPPEGPIRRCFTEDGISTLSMPQFSKAHSPTTLIPPKPSMSFSGCSRRQSPQADAVPVEQPGNSRTALKCP